MPIPSYVKPVETLTIETEQQQQQPVPPVLSSPPSKLSPDHSTTKSLSVPSPSARSLSDSDQTSLQDTPTTNNTTTAPPSIGRQPQFSVSTKTFSMFLLKSIEKIAAERETRKSQNAAVRKACDEAIELLKSDKLSSSSSSSSTDAPSDYDGPSSHLPPLRTDGCVLLADPKLLRPLQLACTLNSAKIVTTAVDSLQKLIAYGHVPNDAMTADGNLPVINDIVNTICSCFRVSS